MYGGDRRCLREEGKTLGDLDECVRHLPNKTKKKSDLIALCITLCKQEEMLMTVDVFGFINYLQCGFTAMRKLKVVHAQIWNYGVVFSPKNNNDESKICEHIYDYIGALRLS